jgi:hypothetical protein
VKLLRFFTKNSCRGKKQNAEGEEKGSAEGAERAAALGAKR